MGDNIMRVMYCNHLHELEILRIENELQEIAKLMKTPFFDTRMYKGMILVYDPKGILKYPVSHKLDGLNLRGPFLFTGNNTIEKDFKSLNMEEIRLLEQKLVREKQELQEELQQELEMGE